jgi:hypothetical protein
MRKTANRTIAPSRPCRYCQGNHFDSACRQGNVYTRAPRAYFVDQTPEYAVHHVEETDDPVYDREHQDFFNAFFSAGNAYDDYERYASEYGGEPINDEIDCGHLTAMPSITKATAVASPMLSARSVTKATVVEQRLTDNVQERHFGPVR